MGLNGSNIHTGGNQVLVSNQSTANNNVPGLPLNHLGSQISYSSGNYNNEIHVTTGVISDGITQIQNPTSAVGISLRESDLFLAGTKENIYASHKS